MRVLNLVMTTVNRPRSAFVNTSPMKEGDGDRIEMEYCAKKLSFRLMIVIIIIIIIIFAL